MAPMQNKCTGHTLRQGSTDDVLWRPLCECLLPGAAMRPSVGELYKDVVVVLQDGTKREPAIRRVVSNLYFIVQIGAVVALLLCQQHDIWTSFAMPQVCALVVGCKSTAALIELPSDCRLESVAQHAFAAVPRHPHTRND